ncbi:hypothetical protein RP726_16085 [Candidatus Methylospira mobilis]|uniref:hypothetical protein n=1 Tax=Candidatus Methylospira mobilis TaxID=1808979 RepID=UPI0028E4F5BF|nr:hypothetical protein [Candidatus Methylospira mobilis]WNV03934.1 hypothetical protein RP726_16085 [Candidatus Methylospira mobilis]
MRIARLCFVAIISMAFCPAYADDQPRFQQPQQAEGRPRIPPAEAFSACEGKKEGDAVTFTSRRGETISGICKTIPAQLAAIPDRPPRGGSNDNSGNQPPPPPVDR